MLIIAPNSTVSAADFCLHLAAEAGVALCPQTELGPFLARAFSPRGSLRRYGLSLEATGPFTCWIINRQTNAGLYVKIRHTDKGVYIDGLRNLGGGRRCGMPLNIPC